MVFFDDIRYAFICVLCAEVNMGFVSLLPILIAVSLALYTKRAIFSLFCGLLSAAILINIDQPYQGLFYIFDPLLIGSLADADSMKVIFFSLLIAIGVEVMRLSGGTEALVACFVRLTQTRKGTMITTWFAGLTVFFDDYANCLIVGSSMRSVTDRARISREKLAYLVDSTAAPVATLALISTWIGYEVSLMDKAINTVAQHSYAQAAQQNSIFVCDPEHRLRNPQLQLNNTPYTLDRTSFGWESTVSSIPENWIVALKDESQTRKATGKNIHSNASIAVQAEAEKLIPCTVPERAHTALMVTHIHPEKSAKTTLMIPNHSALTIHTEAAYQQSVVGEDLQIQLEKPALITLIQGDKQGTILPLSIGTARLEWFEDGIRKEKVNAYAFFLEGLPYRFYPILALVFGLGIACTGRDFGPMWEAENNAQKSDVNESIPELSWGALLIAVVPLTLLIGYTAFDLYQQGVDKIGSDAPIFAIIGEADGYQSMLKGAIIFSFSTIIFALLHKTPPKIITQGITKGGSHLIEPLCVLALAWALGNAISELNTAQYLVGILQHSLPHPLLPSIVFILAAGISFSTGTSFGTMGTLMPLALPLAIQLQVSPEIALATAAAVLSGATWGDHCSPISDTTILSSAGAGCEHISHVRTQLPYALVAGIVSLLFCSLPVGWGIHWSICLLLGSIICLSVILLKGKPPLPRTEST